MKNPLQWIKSTETVHTGYSSAWHYTDDDAIYLLQYELGGVAENAGLTQSV